MIHILYGTDTFYSTTHWDSYYCKSLTSAKKELKRIMGIDNLYTQWLPTMQKEVLKEFDRWVFDKKTLRNIGDLNIEVGELNILVEEIELI